MLRNNDDAGDNQGRLRLNLHFKHDNVGMKIRFQKTVWDNNDSTFVAWRNFPYAFVYGAFLNEQVKISAGRLSDSPWGMGGPERWDTLEDELNQNIAIRTEIKPAPVPGLNVGFVLNGWNEGIPVGLVEENISDLLRETILGASYDHEYFGVHFAYRLDSLTDKSNTSSQDPADVQEGENLIYRVEERFLQTLLPGFQIWANGRYNHLNSGKDFNTEFTNWLYIQYAPALFTAQLRLGYDGVLSESAGKREVALIRGSFYYNILPFLSAGASASYEQDFGLKKSPDSPFYRWNVEPKVKLTMGGSYVELVYHYGSEYTGPDVEEDTHWVNLRLVHTF
jgi:hypothetical protein